MQQQQLSWSNINEEPEDELPSETVEARESRHNGIYKEALALHGEGSPHSEAWSRAKQLYDTVISDKPLGKRVASRLDTPVRFLCLKNLADMVEREGDEARALELQVAAADEDGTDLAVWMKMARLSRAAGLSNLARLALERLLKTNQNHLLALRTLRDLLSEIGDDAACREVTARLLNIDPYGSSYDSGPPRVFLAPVVALANEDGHQSSSPRTLPSFSPPPPRSRCSPFCVERTLEIPSWERLGRLLIDIRAAIVDRTRADGMSPAGGAASNGDGSVGPRSGVDTSVHASSAVPVSTAVALPTSSPLVTLSTPVRIVLRGHDEVGKGVVPMVGATELSRFDAVGGDGVVTMDTAKTAITEEGTGAAVESGQHSLRQEQHEKQQQQQQQQQQQPRRLRRPSVERAMEVYSDGCSSSDEEEGTESRGKRRRGRFSGRPPESAERRTSARRQKQDEIREAHVAAAREDNIEFRVTSMFIRTEASRSINESGPRTPVARADGEPDAEHVWWPQVAGGGGEGERGGGTEEGRAEDGTDLEAVEEEEVALVSRMLPRWRRRHEEECRRCNEGGVLLCCNFCHLVNHPSCLEVTPGPNSLFACSECKEEAAILEWELKGRGTIGKLVTGGVQELLRAADGSRGNAGVVDLMLRWLQGVTTATPEELCLEAAVCAADNRAKGGGKVGVPATEPPPASSTFGAGYQLAAVALAVEPIVRGYLPARLSWPMMLTVGSSPTAAMSSAAVDLEKAIEGGGPELGLACELALAEMRVDKALSLTRQRQQQEQRTADGSKSSGGAMLSPTVDTTPPAVAAGVGVAGDAEGRGGGGGGGVTTPSVASNTTAAIEGSPEGGIGVKGCRSGGVGSSHRSPEDLTREVDDILAKADGAMLQLEPWFVTVADDQSVDSNGESCSDHDEGVGAKHKSSRTVPWGLVVRWWWLRGLRARQAGQADEALVWLSRCEEALARKRKQRPVVDRGSSSSSSSSSGRRKAKKCVPDEGEEDGAVVLLPHCAVHPRLDLQVVRGLVTDVELSGTSETAREAFSGAFLLLANHRAAAETETRENAAAQGGVATATDARVAAAAAAAATSVDIEPCQETRPGGNSGRTGVAANPEHVADNAVGSPNVLLAVDGGVESGPGAPTDPSLSEPERVSPSGGGTGAAGGVDDRGVSPSASSQGTAPLVGGSRAGDVESTTQPTDKDKAIGELKRVMRRLELRFVVRISPPPTSELLLSVSKAAGEGKTHVRGDVDTTGRSNVGGGGDETPAAGGSTTAAERTKDVGVGWTIRFRSSRVEELLSDLLEREKASFTQINRDGARALERLAAAIDKEGTLSNGVTGVATAATPSFFLARTSFTSPTAMLAVPTVAVLADGRRISRTSPTTVKCPRGASGTSNSSKSSAVRIEQLLKLRRHKTLPIDLSGSGLGDKNSVFSMMLRGASFLGRHEMAVLLAVRCTEHFLDASEVLASPRGPLGLGAGGVGSPVRGLRRGGTGVKKNDGLGAVQLLLTSRAEGSDRREVDAAVSTACSEYLAHALVVAIWAVPHVTRTELFGDSGFDGSGNVDNSRRQGRIAATVRRASVVRCLARLMKHSMASDNPRVLSLCVIAWQAIIAVAPEQNHDAMRNNAGMVAFLPERQHVMDVVADVGAGSDSSREIRAEQKSNGDRLAVESAGSSGRRSFSGDTFAADALRDLVRCLCGVIVGRWKQASSLAGKAPKKVWIIHAMEAAHALVRTLEYDQSIRYSTTTGTLGTATDFSSGPGKPGGGDVAVVGNSVIPPMVAGSAALPRRESFIYKTSELREVVEALMGLSQLPDSPTVPTPAPTVAAAAAAAAVAGGTAKGGGGAGGGGGGGGVAGGGGLGLKLTFSLALLALGLSDLACSLDAQRRIGLVEALHDHLKGTMGTAGVTLGGALQGQSGHGGVCADGEGAFLKAALLYLSSEQVKSAVKDEKEKANRVRGACGDGVDSVNNSQGGDDSRYSSSDDDDSINVDSGGGVVNVEDRAVKCLASFNRPPKENRHRDAGGAELVSGGAGEIHKYGRKRRELLGERVLHALSQCQACLYDVAMIPCKDHRCLTPPGTPSTALEAHALYVSWESRLPDLRRSHALRLLETVAAHEAFASPPRTRFSNAVEKHLFLAWPEKASSVTAMAGDGQTVAWQEIGWILGRSKSTFDNAKLQDHSGQGSQAMPFSGEKELVVGGDVGIIDMTAVRSHSCGDKDLGSGDLGAVAEPATSEASACEIGKTSPPGDARGEGTSATVAGTRARESEEGLKDGVESDAGRGVTEESVLLDPDPELETFQRVYLEFYKNLADAKGVPSGFKSSTTKSMDEASDTEAFLMQGIRWRLLDLSFCPNRMSSWKGLAQCACRLAALYLDAFPPSCHRLGMPLTATTGARGVVDASRGGRIPPLSSTAGKNEAVGASVAVAGAKPSSNTDGGMPDSGETVSSSMVSGGVDVSTDVESGVGVGGLDSGTPEIPDTKGMAMEVDTARHAERATDSSPPQIDMDGSSDLASNISKKPPVADSGAPQAPQDSVPDSADGGTHREEAGAAIANTSATTTGAGAGPPSPEPRSASASNDAEAVKNTSSASGSDSDPLGKAGSLTVATDLVVATDDDVVAVERSGRETLKRRREEEPANPKGKDENSPSPVHVLGLRGLPGPDFSPFFRGSALDVKAARKDGGGRLAAVADGLRRMGKSGARTSIEASAAEAMATRVVDGTATQEEWTACLGHASIAAAVGTAERSFLAWKALAEEALVKGCRPVREDRGIEGRDSEAGSIDEDPNSSEAARSLAECCEEEAFLKFMLARDVWPRENEGSSYKEFFTTNRKGSTLPARIPAGLEAGGRQRLLESSLALLQRSRRLRETGELSSPIWSSSSGDQQTRRRLSGSPLPMPRSPKALLSDSSPGAFRVLGKGGEGGQDKPVAKKRRKLSDVSSKGGLDDSARIRGGEGAEGQEEENERDQDNARPRGEREAPEDDEDEDDVLRWQVPFVMGRLSVQLGKDPRTVLEKLAEALRLAQAEHVPLEDELEALCRLHAARVEVALLGDLERFLGVASTIEEFAFREESDDEEELSDFAPPPAFFSASSPSGDDGGDDDDSSAVTAVGRLEDGRKRRLGILENCLDAFDSCLEKRKSQHTALFAKAYTLHKGASVVSDARQGFLRTESLSKQRSFGPQAALSTLKPLFEKRQQLLLAMSASDGVVGPGLALLSSRRRRVHALKRKYYALYIELLEETNSTATLQGLLRRTKGARETRDEVIWVQGQVLRALLALLRSEVDARACRLAEATRTTAASAPASSPKEASVSPVSSALSPQANPATVPRSAVATAATAVPVAQDKDSSATAAATTSSADMEVIEGTGVINSDETRTGTAGASSVPTTTRESSAGVASVAGAPSSGAVPAPTVGGRKPGVGDGGSSAAEGGGEGEKRALESVWSVYLQVVDLDSSAKSGSLAGGGGGLTLLGEAEDLLVKSWQAFGSANPSVLELVELQNPLTAPGGGGVSGTAVGGGEDGGGMLLRRARACCHIFWPDKQGKAKVSKSKLKLKRPAATAALPQTASANRAASRPKLQTRPAPPSSAAGSSSSATAVEAAAAGATGTAAVTESTRPSAASEISSAAERTEGRAAGGQITEDEPA